MNAETVESLTSQIRSLDDKLEAIKAARRSLVQRRLLLLREPKTEKLRKRRNSTLVATKDIIRLKQKGWSNERIRDHFGMLGTAKIVSEWHRFRYFRQHNEACYPGDTAERFGLPGADSKKISEKTC